LVGNCNGVYTIPAYKWNVFTYPKIGMSRVNNLTLTFGFYSKAGVHRTDRPHSQFCSMKRDLYSVFESFEDHAARE